MIIKEITGDLFKEEYNKDNDIYVHCVSSDFVMGKGIAKTFKDKYPELRKKEILVEKFKSSRFERLLVVRTKEVTVANLVTKKYFFNKPSYRTLEESLLDLKYYIMNTEKMDVKRLLMPRIGCGLDRLKWDKVKDILTNVFKDTEIEILVFNI